MSRTRPWEVSDQWWEKVKPFIPSAPSHAKGGRPRMDDRRTFEAIMYVLRTGSHGAWLKELFPQPSSESHMPSQKHFSLERLTTS